MEIDLKNCENCKYLRQHYVIGVDGHFVKLRGAFDCFHPKVNQKNFKKIKKQQIACEYWETIRLQYEENENKLLYTLRFICKRLNTIADVLESDALDKAE